LAKCAAESFESLVIHFLLAESAGHDARLILEAVSEFFQFRAAQVMDLLPDEIDLIACALSGLLNVGEPLRYLCLVRQPPGEPDQGGSNGEFEQTNGREDDGTHGKALPDWGRGLDVAPQYSKEGSQGKMNWV